MKAEHTDKEGVELAKQFHVVCPHRWPSDEGVRLEGGKPALDSHFRGGSFLRSSQTSDFKIGTPEATLSTSLIYMYTALPTPVQYQHKHRHSCHQTFQLTEPHTCKHEMSCNKEGAHG